ncbi:ras-related protein Rab-22A-like [Actinia tenebrosa]|uniref:Ras-related protein Rab-22A-like n=1 Tax=Actinia tenebrosa TaxID=6105 RepID=A0A6P8IR32_ACTTE|nr:ras-related protein Rab-22A-like [Actinia tenebrosa]
MSSYGSQGDSIRELKVCLLGDAGVGKSCLVHRFVSDTFNAASPPTIGAAFMTKMMIIDENAFKFNIWDTAGQERFKSLAPLYYRDAAAAILVYDITSDPTFHALRPWIRELQRYGPPDIVIAIAGNKCDKAEQREVSTHEAQEFANSVDAIFAETSALTSLNVHFLFEELCKKLPQEKIVSPYGTASRNQNTQSRIRPDQAPAKRNCGCS